MIAHDLQERLKEALKGGNEATTLNAIIQGHENKIVLLSSEIERLNQVIRKAESELRGKELTHGEVARITAESNQKIAFLTQDN